jgi:cell division protein ZapA
VRVSEPAYRVVRVAIQSHHYPIRSQLDASYVAELAGYVDAKMQAVADVTPTGDTLRLAVVAAINIADEFFRCRDANRAQGGRLAERTEALEALVDRLLLDEGAEP